MVLLGSAYITPTCDPLNDYYLSPIRTPSEILSRFPPTRLQCGDCDQLISDSRRFVARLKNAHSDIDIEYQEPSWILPQQMLQLI